MTTKEYEYEIPEGLVKLSHYKVVKSYTNGFAENCLELENGTIIRISYNQDSIEVEEPIK